MSVKGNRMGRRKRSVEYEEAKNILATNARHAAHYVIGVVRGEFKRPGALRLKAAMYCLDQVLGKATIRVEGLNNANITYNQLIIQAKERAAELSVAPGTALAVIENTTEEESDNGDSRTSDVLAADSLPGNEDTEAGRRGTGMP